MGLQGIQLAISLGKTVSAKSDWWAQLTKVCSRKRYLDAGFKGQTFEKRKNLNSLEYSFEFECLFLAAEVRANGRVSATAFVSGYFLNVSAHTRRGIKNGSAHTHTAA